VQEKFRLIAFNHLFPISSSLFRERGAQKKSKKGERVKEVQRHQDKLFYGEMFAFSLFTS
jgi:hypothetical protein